jgi:FAD/FMN-containing dehydrogenase
MTAPTTLQIPGFRGDLITPDHHDYDGARAVWNGTVDRRPRLIARCSGTADVAAAVRFARDRDLEIAVRGGGHNVAGTAVCDDGIVIDLSAMRAVSVDPVERTALVQGGALWGDVDRETQAHGLATTGGIVGHTGVGGLSLGGGIGWLMRKHGLTVDNLVQAEMVTAEGDIVRASANDHPDLFWALRGGGGNFGVVSSFRFALHPVGPTVMAGPVFWAAEDTTDVLRFYREFVADAPDELGTVVRLGTIPPELVVDEDLHFRPAIAVASCYAGPVEDGERAVRALRQFGTPLVDLVEPTLYVDHQSSIDDTVPMAGTTTGKPRTSPACPTRSSTSSPSMPTAPPHRGRTRRCSTWVAQLLERLGAPRPTRDAMWITTSSSTLCGSRSRTTPSGRLRPRGHENSSTPSNPIVPVST